MAQTQYKSIDLRGYLDLNKNELRNATLQNLGSDIGSPVDGLIFYRSDTDRARLRANGAWVDLATMDDVTAAGISSNLIDAKGDLIVGSAADTVVRQAVGADGAFLVAASGQTSGLQWRTIADSDIPSAITRDTEVFLLSAYTTKGDIGIATGAGAVARHGVGANGTFLVANSAQSTGWESRAIVAGDISEKIATSDLTDWPRSAALDLNSQKITGLADGTAASDAATFGQVNAILEGKQWKQPAQAATTGALPNTPTYSSGAGTLTAASNTTLAAQDGVTLAVGDSLLVKNQASSFQNGIYTLTAAGSGAAPWVLTRRADASTFDELQASATVYVSGGTTQGGDVYTQTATLTNLTSDTQMWTKTGDTNTVYTADSTTITLTGTQFSLSTGGITNAHVNGSAAIAYSKLNLATSIVNGDIAANAAIAYSKLNLATSIVNADVAANAAIVYSKLDSSLVRKFAAAITGGATTEVVTHNLNTRDIVSVRLINNSTPWDMVEVEWAATSVNTVTLSSPVNLPADYRVVVAA